MERDDARGEHPQRTDRAREGWDRGTEHLSAAEWKALLDAADRGRLEDAEA